MSTRRAQPQASVSQDRFMCSSEIAELRGISGMAAAKRCALLVSPAKRQLLWFIQGLSVLQGGCNTLAGELLKMFPDRVGTPMMHKLGMRKNQCYTGEQARRIEAELDDSSDCTAALLRRCVGDASELLDETWDGSHVAAPVDYGPPVPWQDLYAKCLNAAEERLPEFLLDLCINPRVFIQLNQPEVEADGRKRNLFEDEIRELRATDCRPAEPAEVVYFRDVIGALMEYKRRYEDRVKADFFLTAIGRQVWKQLDDALRTRTMIVIDGREGRGKTEAVRAWCNCHLGEARFASLDRTSSRIAHIREIAKPLGIGHGNSRTGLEMQTSVKEVLQISHLMIVIDEAHYLFNQNERHSGRPELLDWIDTALCNPPLPVALVTTPQFLDCMERAVIQSGWNYRQFKRRCQYIRLPAKNTPHDVEAVARKLLPGADKATIMQIMGYEALSNRDLSAVADVVRKAKLLGDEADASQVTFEHVKRAIHELIVSDTPWAEMEKRIQQRKLGRKALPEAPALVPAPAQERAETQERDINPPLSRNVSGGSRLRFQVADPALETAQELPVLIPV